MPFPTSGSFDYWQGGRALATLPKTTGDFDYWLGGRPLTTQTEAVGQIVPFLKSYIRSDPLNPRRLG